MNKYLLSYYRKGNVRFLSHLDMLRLFKRSIKRNEIDIAYSQGFNPHERINLVLALSLGFESSGDMFEMVCNSKQDTQKLLNSLNEALPEGVKFTSCKEIPYTSSYLTGTVKKAFYEAVFPCSKEDFNNFNVQAFLDQEQIIILRWEKKAQKKTERDVKNLIFQLDFSYENGFATAKLLLGASSANIVNPLNVLDSFFAFSDYNLPREMVRVDRKYITCEKDGTEISMLDY